MCVCIINYKYNYIIIYVFFFFYRKLHQRFDMTTAWRKEWIERKGLKVAEARSPSSKGLLTPFVHCTRGSVAFQSLFKPITITGATLYLARLNTEYFTLTSHLFFGCRETKTKGTCQNTIENNSRKWRINLDYIRKKNLNWRFPISTIFTGLSGLSLLQKMYLPGCHIHNLQICRHIYKHIRFKKCINR